MSTAPAARLATGGDPPIPPIARMFEAYFKILEGQAVRFENVASRLEEKDKRAVLDLVAGLRKEVQAIREQVQLFAEWA
jgi:hypothetical protein